MWSVCFLVYICFPSHFVVGGGRGNFWIFDVTMYDVTDVLSFWYLCSSRHWICCSFVFLRKDCDVCWFEFLVYWEAPFVLFSVNCVVQEMDLILGFLFYYSKPSLIALQLIRIEIWKMKNAPHRWVHTLKDTWHLGRQMRNLSVQTEPDSFFKPTLLRLEKQVQLLSLLSTNKCSLFLWFLNKGSTVIFLLFIFLGTIYIIKFSIYLCSEFFVFQGYLLLH
jgi:hypothetical protein